MKILEAKSLYKAYSEKDVLVNINIEFEKGKIYSLVGANGSGKTTLLKLLHGDLKASKGQIMLNGENINNLNEREISTQIAILNQTNNQNIDFKVSKLISYGRNPYKKLFEGITKEDEKIIEWALNKTGLTKYKDRKLNELSGGEKQRVWIAMALTQRPQILMLDEPTTYLDIAHQIKILELIKRLNKEENITIVMVLHDLNQALKYSDEVVVLKNKKILNQGHPDEIINSKILDDAFGVNSIAINDSRLSQAVFYPIGFK
ncbi:ABC transporter ATP-binding protein [Anaerococcus provencensis]|uniref:ABC transporter ATP-binding protein n=1 Tax=Anaerococcus provencensis TaxID=938293 RepID=UPI0002D8455A|nr:ABC transporter ATP-binding protein [Anaerococcus provencensis]